MFCGNCGNELRPNAKFCPKCGSKVNPIITQPGRQAPADFGLVQKPYETFEGNTATAIQTKPKQKWSKKAKIGIGVLVILLMILVFSVLGKGTNSSNGLVKSGNQFGLAFDMSIEEYIDRHNAVLNAYIDSDPDKEKIRELWEKVGVFLSLDRIDKGNKNIYGEDTYIYTAYNNVAGTLSMMSFTVYDGKVTSISVFQPIAYELSFQQSLFSIAAMLTVIDPEQTSTIEDNFSKIQPWLEENIRRKDAGESLVDYFVNNVQYSIGETGGTADSASVIYMVRAMTDEGYELLHTQGAS